MLLRGQLAKTDLLEATETHQVLDFGQVQAKAAAAVLEQQQEEVLGVLKEREDCLLARLARLRLLLLELAAMATHPTLARVAVRVEE